MHRVFLVEDEIVARESIRDNVAWGTNGFALVGEAADGEMALPLIEETRPDILVTDIKMPFMDGLTLSRLVRKSSPWVKIILISGHDEFELAREAIGIAVTDYLLKPLSAADLLRALEAVGRTIDEEAREKKKLDELSARLKSSTQAMAARFLSDLVTGLVPTGKAIDNARRLGIELVSRHYIVAQISPAPAGPSDGESMYAEYLKAANLIDSLVAESPEVLTFIPSLKQTVLIFRGEDPAALESQCYSLCHSIKFQVERMTTCLLTISVGGVRERIQGIAESYREATAAVRFDYIFGDHSVIGIGDTKRAQLRSSELLSLGDGEILACLKRGEREALEAARDAFLSRLRTTRLGSFLEGYAVVNLVVSVARFVEELGGEVGPIVGDLDTFKAILESGDEQRLEKALGDLLHNAFNFRENRRNTRYADTIARAKSFIAASFASEDISLNAVAEHVHVSPSHFSTIFSHETGHTFIEFLTDMRITRAQELLKSSTLRSSEIGYSVGYKDPHYFSYIFKSKTGLSPTEFRQGRHA